MLRRGNLVQTYGRHRNRVVNVVDVWSPNITNDNVFGSSDENGSLSDFRSPVVSTRPRQKVNGKENTGGGRRLRKRVTAKNTEAPPVAKTGKRKAPPRCRPPLHDASNVSTEESPAMKQQIRRCKKVDKSCRELSSQFNFSELDKYSLIMSDSVEVEAEVSVGWKHTGTVTTSTPHVAPSGRASAVAPPSTSYRNSVSPLSMCRVELERLHVSDVSNITGSSTADSYHGDSPSMEARLRLRCSAEGGDVTSPYDVSCDLFDDAPSSQTQSRRSMYLLRSRQKGTTRFTNNSLGGSMCQLRSLSPVTYFSDDEVVVLSGESSDEEEAPSSGESEESLSDICEEEESASAMSETSGADESVSSRLSCPSPIGRSQNSIKSVLTSSRELSSNVSCETEPPLGTSRHSIKVALTPRKTSCPPLSARERVLAQCDQKDVCRFTDCITPAMMKTITKIGEGVYGEVFRAQRRGRSVALKVIPIEGDFLVNDEPQKTFEEMLPEIVISKLFPVGCRELSALRDNDVNQTENFVHVHGVYVVQGSYPATLLKQWELFHKRKGSENDRPDKYTDSQLFLVFEFADSGADLESFQFHSLEEAHSVLVQVTTALAIAEAELQFEHRDLHWGNVLVSRTKDATINFCHEGTPLRIESLGVKVAIIDFTLSRLSQDGCQVFTDLSQDPTLFTGTNNYQFDIYRLMKKENSNDWMPHHPFTNVLWIHYLADKLVHGKTYAAASTNRAQHQAALRQFRTFLRSALDYDSAVALLQNPFI